MAGRLEARVVLQETEELKSVTQLELDYKYLTLHLHQDL